MENENNQNKGYNDSVPGPTRYDIPISAENQEAQQNQYAQVNADAKNDTFAISSLVLGVASIGFLIFIPILGIFVSPIAGILGIIFGVIGRKSVKNKGLATAGLIISITDLAFVVILSILLAIFGAAIISTIISALSGLVGDYQIPKTPIFFN